VNVLLDTNIFIRMANRGCPDHELSLSAVESLKRKQHLLCVVPQVLYEYWVVATRPATVNGLGLSTQQAAADVKVIQSQFRLLPENQNVVHHWHTLVVQNEVSGKAAHDARLVAAMKEHQTERLLTFNERHFARYSIRAIHPQSV